MRKVFGFFKSFVQFIQILILFTVLMLLLYWIQNLTNARWDWINFIKPVLDSFLWLGEMTSRESVILFDAVFEYKYFWALVYLIVFYCLAYLTIFLLDYLENLYGEGKEIFKKAEEKRFNTELERKNSSEQKKIKRYQIYVSAFVKKKFSHKELGVNLEEQLRIMNKFLIEKTGVNPIKFGEGFLYSFENFDRIDDILDKFFRLIKSTAPLDYIICVQIIGASPSKEIEQLKKLISLNIANKITTLPDTVWRYKANVSHRYGTTQLGLFQKDSGTFEVHEFCEI